MSGTLEVLLRYVNRQVVINVYEEDELLSKDGFIFNEICFNADCIQFIHDSRVIHELKVDDPIHLAQLHGFSRYYAIYHNGLRSELYFP